MECSQVAAKVHEDESFEDCIAIMLNASRRAGVKEGLQEAMKMTATGIPLDSHPLLSKDAEKEYRMAVKDYEDFINPVVASVDSLTLSDDGISHLRAYLSSSGEGTSGAGGDGNGEEEEPLDYGDSPPAS